MKKKPKPKRKPAPKSTRPNFPPVLRIDKRVRHPEIPLRAYAE